MEEFQNYFKIDKYNVALIDKIPFLITDANRFKYGIVNIASTVIKEIRGNTDAQDSAKIYNTLIIIKKNENNKKIKQMVE